MKVLDLRTRLLTAIAVVAVLQIALAIVALSVTHSQLIDQIDDRLAIASSPDRGPGFVARETRPPPGDEGRNRRERLGDTYEGILSDDGSLITLFAPNTTGTERPPPTIDLELAEGAAGRPITVDSSDGDFRYRLVAPRIADGSILVIAIPLDGVDATMAGLTVVVASTVLVISLVLAIATWWVLRLGLAPIKRMTNTAEAIADGDLSERISDVDQRTEAGRLGHALNTMLTRIETSFDERDRAERRLRRFIADASHELRTPVATIRGYAELYQAGGLDQQVELDDAMRRTEQESQRMSRLITDMLNLAKLDQDPTLTTRPVDLAALARDAAADAHVTHPNRVISAIVADDPVVIEGDEDLLRQALANLVGNAIVHTDISSTIDIHVNNGDRGAVVVVADDGPGMTPEVVAKTTERFFRADPSRSRHKGGSGLGLAIVDSIISVHRGTLGIDSSPGEGTTVTITLPSRRQPQGVGTTRSR